MAGTVKRLEGIAIFSTEQYGFNKEQVGNHLTEIQRQYEKLREENLRLKKQIKNMKDKMQAKAT